MILIDTSVWIDHFRRPLSPLAALLLDGQAAAHPFVIGELACGRLANRRETLSLLAELPSLEPVEHEEVLALLERRGLMGGGLGWIDAHLLAAATVSGSRLWTTDRRLRRAADQLNLGFEPRRPA